MYQKQIEQLVILQRLDEEIIGLNQELANAPRELEELEKRHASVQERKTQALEKVDMLKDQKKRLEQEIEEDGLRIKKSKNKLMMASNTREYHAMMREMDNMEKLNRLREEENATLTEELARQDELLAGIDAEAKTVDDELAEKRAGLDARIKDAQKQLDGLMKQRAQAGEIIPPPILSRYEFIRSRLQNPVIVSVNKGVCSGCYIVIPPQTYNDLQKGQQIHSCPNCQRLIYWLEHLPGAEAEEAAEA